METVTIPKSEYLRLQKAVQLLEMLRNDAVFVEKIQTVYKFITQVSEEPDTNQNETLTEPAGMIRAKRKGDYVGLFGKWSDMTMTSEEYRQQLWQRKSTF